MKKLLLLFFVFITTSVYALPIASPANKFWDGYVECLSWFKSLFN